MMITRRGVVAGLSASGAFPYIAHAAWPERPITMLHGLLPAAAQTRIARIAADGLCQAAWSNLSSSNQGLERAQRSQAHSSCAQRQTVTRSRCSPPHIPASAALYKNLPYRPIEDISPISLLSEAPDVFVTHAEHPAQSLQQLLDMARKQGGSITYGTPGVGSGPHLTTELLAHRAGVKFTHVPFRGGAQAVIEVLAKRIDFMTDPPLSMIEHLKSGKFRALAASTATRFAGLPDTPTVANWGCRISMLASGSVWSRPPARRTR